MSKTGQQNRAEIQLGNETYDRGLADGIAGRPKSIKKTHRHAHRYHIGYRQGQRQREVCRIKSKVEVPDNAVIHALIAQQDKAPVTFWKRLRNWLVGV